MDDIEKEIQSLVAKVIRLPEDQVTMDANIFSDLKVDSLLGVEILAALDKKYSIDVPEDKLRSFKTIRDIVDAVKRLRDK